MHNAVAYCRVSTDGKDQLNSLQTQKDFFETYAVKSGMNLIRIYSDQGISGTQTKNRAAFNQMMQDAKTGSFETVLIKDVSRLARNTLTLLESCRTLRSLGIEVQFLNHQMNNMGNSEFLLTLYAAMAQEESYNTSKRIKFSKKFNAEKGRVPNLVFGYDKIKGDYFHLNVNEKEADTVRFIFEQYTNQKNGTLKIAQELNRSGIRTKRNAEWTQNTVARILTNPIYIGKIVNGKEEIINFPESIRTKREEKDLIIVQNEELRLIDDKTFEKAQSLLKERRNTFQNKKTRYSNKYIFSTLIKCAECGLSFRRVERTYQNTYIRWVCSGRNGHGTDACTNAISLDEELLISKLQQYFSSLLSSKERYIAKAKEDFSKNYMNNTEKETKQEEIRKKIAQMKKQREKMLQLFTADLISLNEFQEKTQEARIEIPRLESELQTLCACSPENSDFEKALDEAFRDIEKITDIHALSNAEMREFIREIKVDKNGYIDVYLNIFQPF